MIGVDTNIIAYLYLPSDLTAQAEALLEQDAHWVAPILWRSELRNVLALYLRQALLDLDTAMAIQAQAEQLMADNEFAVTSDQVLALAEESSCSAYDCEFIALAAALEIPLITTDKKLIRAFPQRAIALQAYLQ